MWIFLLIIGVGCSYLLLSPFFWGLIGKLSRGVLCEIFKPPIQTNWKDMDNIEHTSRIFTPKPIMKTPTRIVRTPMIKPQEQGKDFSKLAVQVDEAELNKWLQNNPEVHVEEKR